MVVALFGMKGDRAVTNIIVMGATCILRDDNVSSQTPLLLVTFMQRQIIFPVD